MPRKAAPSAELVQDAPVNEEAVNVIQNLGAIAQGLQDERDLANQILGQVQMARSIARFADVVSLSKLAHIKETKMYRALQGKKGIDADGNEIADVGTWDGFCQALGLSRSKVDEDLTNLKAFGEEALKQLGAIGAGYRELRQWRRLPEDAKSALIEASKQGNLDAVQYLAEELIHTHTKEKDELQKKLTDTQADYDALGEVLSKKNAELDRTKQDLEKAKRRIETMSADDAAKELRQEVVGIAFEAEADISGKLRAAFESLEQHATETGSDHRAFQAQLIAHLQRLLGDLITEFQLPAIAEEEEDFSWMHQPGVAPTTETEA
jgi:vacuolar-type H+-ATPase subunit I/STV1